MWPASKEEREAIVEGYRGRLATIDCKWFARGEGTCPFGTSCFYCHRYEGNNDDSMSFSAL